MTAWQERMVGWKEYKTKRADEMASMYRSGMTLQEIGVRYQLTRERVRQILKLAGLNHTDGGAHIRAVTNGCHVRKKQAQDANSIRRFGLSKTEMDAIRRRYGSGSSKTSPIHIFVSQRRNMVIHHKIPWELTFAEWWKIWQASGKWKERIGSRRRFTYTLARINGIGAFTADNVHIIRLAAAARQYQRHKWREIRGN